MKERKRNVSDRKTSSSHNKEEFREEFSEKGEKARKEVTDLCGCLEEKAQQNPRASSTTKKSSGNSSETRKRFSTFMLNSQLFPTFVGRIKQKTVFFSFPQIISTQKNRRKNKKKLTT